MFQPAATTRSPDHCKQIARDLVNGLHRGLHTAGVVHCDIKPSNVLLTRGGQALIGDFDGARQVDVTMTRVHDLQVTQKYLAQEFLDGEAKDATKAMDMFALGTLFHELFQGASLGPSTRTLFAKLITVDPRDRPVIEDVARNALFDARPVELRDCGCCYDKQRLEDGLECAEKHFLCTSCLDDGLRAYLKPDSDRDPRIGNDLSVGCLQGPACGARLALRDLARLVSEPTLAKVREREQGRRDANVQQQLRREYYERLKAELARKKDDVIFTRHRDHLLSSRPRCRLCDCPTSLSIGRSLIRSLPERLSYEPESYQVRWFCRMTAEKTWPSPWDAFRLDFPASLPALRHPSAGCSN
jgi:serine/threonine protein kinase